MNSVIKSLLMICVILIISVNSYAADQMKFNPDEVVVKALSHKSKDVGSLTELLKENEIKVVGEKKTIDDFFRDLGIDPKKTKSIEGYTIMRWSIKRIRVSVKYEFFIQLALSESGEERVTNVSVIPHIERLLHHNLSNQKNWSSVIFDVTDK